MIGLTLCSKPAVKPKIWKVFYMKRLFSLLLCAVMLLGMTACGSTHNANPAETAEHATTPATEPAPTAAPTAPAAVMGEAVLVDHDNAVFSVIRAENSDHAGMQIHVQCVNKSDRALMFAWDMVSVCGYMYDPMWAVEVAAGKTANSVIDLDTYALEQMDIKAVDEITFTLRIYDSENWMEAPMVQEVHTIYPTGLNADTLVLPERIPRDGQTVIAEDENIRFVIENAGAQDSAYTVNVYMENKTDKNLMYSWDLVSVDGIMVDPFWAVSVAAGKRACSEISFRRSDLEENGITDISAIEFRLIVSDYDNWDTPNLLEETYTYNPQQ